MFSYFVIAVLCCSLVAMTEAYTSKRIYGLQLVHNSPAKGGLFSINPSSGQVNEISGPLNVLSGSDDLSAIVNGVYHYIGDTPSGATLVGVNITTGNTTCLRTLPIREVEFVGIGQTLDYDPVNQRLLVTGISTANQSQHAILIGVPS